MGNIIARSEQALARGTLGLVVAVLAVVAVVVGLGIEVGAVG